ncbi:MAG TPA: hypothetical protein ENI23_07765 [bacterium]|nr:hypothetical protein [bacterium]
MKVFLSENKVLKAIFILIGVFFFMLLLSQKAMAQVSIISRDGNNLDEGLSKEDLRFTSPEKIKVIPITRPDTVDESDRDWFRGLYYFYTARLGFPDIPFHFVVASNGDVYAGNKGGDEQVISVEGEDQGVILIGYLADKDETNFSLSSFKGLEAIILEIANRNSIKPEKVEVGATEIVVNLEDRSVKLRSKDLFGSWNAGISDVVSSIQDDYKPTQKTYAIELLEVTSPEGDFLPGESAIVGLRIRNTGKFSIYQGTDGEILALTKNENDSRFFVNGVWASPKQPIIMEEGSIIRPGQERDFKFKLNISLFFGEQTETFKLTNTDGRVFSDTEFVVKITVGGIEQKVVEILATETGYLNVRASASGGANVTSKVNPGQRYILLEDSETGWYKIDLGDGNSGWIARQYARIVN